MYTHVPVEYYIHIHELVRVLKCFVYSLNKLLHSFIIEEKHFLC